MPPLISGFRADVEPGDLIRAQDYNALLAWLRELEERVSTLEGADESVAITAVLPAGPVRIGDTIEIIGRNFGFSFGAHRVYFNSTRATAFSADSGDSRLVLTVPQVPGVSDAGTQVVLTVGNQSSVDTEEITLRPAVLQQEGAIGLLYTGVTIDGETATEIPAGSTVRFTFNLEADTLLPATVSLAPTISVAAWQNLLEVLDSDGALLTSRQITLEPGQMTTFAVSLPVPDDAADQSFTLALTAQASGVPAATISQPFTVGEPLTPTDPTVIALRVRQVRPSTAIAGNTLRLTSGQTVNVQLQGEFAGPADGGQHVYTVAVDDLAAPWQGAVPSTFPPFAAPAEFTITGPATQDLSFDVTRQAGAASPTTLTCRLQRTTEDGTTLETRMQFTLQPV
jgi:hypothetical protein